MDFDQFTLSQWKAAGSQGDYYAWLKQNAEQLKAQYSQTARGTSQSQWSANAPGGEGQQQRFQKEQYAKFLKEKYGATQTADGRLVGPTGGALTQPFDKKDAFENWYQYNKEKVDAAWSEQQGAASLAADRKKVTDNLQKFYDMLSAPVMGADGTYTDPLAKQLAASAVNTAQGESTRRGIGGALGATQAMASTAGALQPYLAQRQQLAGQAAQLLSQRDLALEDQRLKADSLELSRVGMENDIAGEQWSAKQNQAQGIGSAIGTAVGALGFIGGPQLGAAGMAAGGALGGGLGGLSTGGSGPTLSRPRFGNSSGRGNF